MFSVFLIFFDFLERENHDKDVSLSRFWYYDGNFMFGNII